MLLMSPLTGTVKEREMTSSRIVRYYSDRATEKGLANRSLDPDPGLDKLNFYCLKDVFRERMKFKFDFCHEKDWLKPRKLLTDRDQGDVLCYILKVHLNVDIVEQGYRPVYSGDTDELIKGEV